MIKLKDVLNEKLARGLKPLLQLGATIKSNVGEKVLLKLSDKFEDIDDEQAEDIASHLNMAIELMQDGKQGLATKAIKAFNKACKDASAGKPVKSVFEGKVNVVKEGKFEDAVEEVELGIYGMAPKVVANVLVKALKSSFGSTATKIVLEINKLMKIR